LDAAKWALLVGPERISREIASALEKEIARQGRVVLLLALRSGRDFVTSHLDRHGFAPDLFSELGYEAVLRVAAAAQVADQPTDPARVLVSPKSSVSDRRLDSWDVDVQAFPRIWVLRNAEANRQERAAALEESERRERIQQHLRELEERQRER
jgi:hypothetical protein